MQRSEYLGVYTIPEDKRGEEGHAYRVALKIRDRNTGKFTWRNINATFASEEAAARVYTGYAIVFFGKGAIINAVPGDLGRAEAGLYWLAKDNRTATKLKMVEKYERLTADGFEFKTHTQLREEQNARRDNHPQRSMVA